MLDVLVGVVGKVIALPQVIHIRAGDQRPIGGNRGTLKSCF